MDLTRIYLTGTHYANLVRMGSVPHSTRGTTDKFVIEHPVDCPSLIAVDLHTTLF